MARRSTTRSRGATRKTPPPLPARGPGERYWVLDVPYEERALLVGSGAVWRGDLKVTLWVGRRLPAGLAAFESQPFSHERFVEDALNGTQRELSEAGMRFTPRPLQVEGARAIARRAAAGGSQFLLADEPGVGKTITAIIGAKAVCALRKGTRILVVADRPAAITLGHWRRSILGVGDGGFTWLVTTWDRIGKVKGHDWDVVIADEAQRVRHTTTQRWQHFLRLSGFARKTRRPFVICATATPSHTPLELTYLSGLFADVRGGSAKDWVEAFPEHLRQNGIGITSSRYGPEWSEDTVRRASDVRRVLGWMTSQTPPAMIHREAPQGPPEINGMAVRLTPARYLQYQAEWAEFCAAMNLARRGKDVARGRASLLRYRQKAGLLRVDATVEWVIGQVEADRQVAVSVQYVETAAVPIREGLEAAGLAVAGIYGGRPDGERERLRFQTGKAPVVVFTPTASISLHAGEKLSASSSASSTHRVGVFHQPRFSGIEGRQIIGRTHRDGVRSPWWLLYCEGTVEERVARVMIERMGQAADTVGGDTTALAQVARFLGADWLPAQDLTDA